MIPGVSRKEALTALVAALLAFPLLWVMGWALYLALRAIEIIIWR